MEPTTDTTQALQTAVWATVNQIAQEQGMEIGKQISADCIASLANVIYKQMEVFAMDLEAFSSHGRRTVVSADDVLLCARRNDSLHDLLFGMLQEIAKKKPSEKHAK